jgi:hypothetical protein
MEKKIVTVCSYCLHVLDANKQPKPERVTDPAQFEKETGLAVSHGACQVCMDAERVKLAEYKAKKKAGVS